MCHQYLDFRDYVLTASQKIYATVYCIFLFADSSSEAAPRPVSAPVISSNDTNDRVKDNANEVTLSLRRPRSSAEDKGKDIFHF